jgi:predicted DNA-binding transcriptional regulator AlpA
MVAMTDNRDDGIDILFKEPDVCRFTGWSRSKLRAEIALGNFDPQVKTGARGSAWFGESIRKHQAKLKAQYDK